MKIEKTSYPGWSNHPCYRVSTRDSYMEICRWMYQNEVEHFMLSSGSGGYTFQVKSNKEWFALKWS
jgi:hypothetical protein